MATLADPTKRTSIDEYRPPEAVVRFRRWTRCYGSAYQRNQEAGFTRAQADLLVRRGAADIIAVSGQPAGGFVTK